MRFSVLFAFKDALGAHQTDGRAVHPDLAKGPVRAFVGDVWYQRALNTFRILVNMLCQLPSYRLKMTMQVLLKLSFKTVLYSCLVIILLQAPRALAYDGPKIAFDAIYEVVLPMGSGTLRQASDGHGHMLSLNTAFNGNEDGQILDFNKGLSTLIIPRKKVAILMKMTASSANLIYDNSISKKADAKPLGEKTIGGHPCHGWQTSTAGVSTESWIGDDIKYLVQSQTTSGKIKMTMTLKKWSSTGPGESVFQIPADYKLNQFSGNNSGQSLDAGDLATVSDLLKANKTLEAVDQLSKMLAKNPVDKTLLIMRGGILYRSLNRSDEALKDFNKAISVDPDFYQHVFVSPRSMVKDILLVDCFMQEKGKTRRRLKISTKPRNTMCKT
jgi:tetratricopeptide (TPR) repeat protein